MKKHYIQPSTIIVVCKSQQLLTTFSNQDVPFGGHDDGSHTPGSRSSNYSFWDED